MKERSHFGDGIEDKVGQPHAALFDEQAGRPLLLLAVALEAGVDLPVDGLAEGVHVAEEERLQRVFGRVFLVVDDEVDQLDHVDTSVFNEAVFCDFRAAELQQGL